MGKSEAGLIVWLLNRFVSRSIALWSITKKKPIFTYTTAHGLDEMESSTEGKLQRPRWIVSLACLRYGDLFASGK